MMMHVAIVFVGLFACVTCATKTPCIKEESIEITDGRLLRNGSLIDPQDGTIYPKGTFWKESKYIYRGCICKIKPCIRKCCSRYEYREENCTYPSHLTNRQIDELFNPLVFEISTLEPSSVNETAFSRFGVLYEPICSTDRYRLEPDEYPETDQFYLLPNGSLHVPGMQTSLGVDQFCLEYFTDKGTVLPLVCFPPETTGASAVLFTMYPVGMLLSTVFMVITLAVYALLPELRNLHGKLLMCHVASLLAAYVSLALVQLATTVIPEWLCITTAFMIEFTFVAAFFWLNIMCFDICWMFSGLSSMRGTTAERDRRKLLIYSLYAWGCPLLLLVISLVMEFAPWVPDSAPKPNFGIDRCWFQDKLSIFLYFFGPISLLLLCNLVLFILTAIRIVRLRKGTAVLKHADSQRSDQRENQQNDSRAKITFVLYLKLFLVMGLTWIMEVVSWTVGGSYYLWIITDVCNTLQGLCIFLIFVWKAKVRRLVYARLFPKKRPQSCQTDSSAKRTSNKIAQFLKNDSSTDNGRPATQTTSLMADSMPDVAKSTVQSVDI